MLIAAGQPPVNLAGLFDPAGPLSCYDLPGFDVIDSRRGGTVAASDP